MPSIVEGKDIGLVNELTAALNAITGRLMRRHSDEAAGAVAARLTGETLPKNTDSGFNCHDKATIDSPGIAASLHD